MAVLWGGQRGVGFCALFALICTVKSDLSCDIEVENTLKTLLTPQEFSSIQLQSLRKELLRRIQDSLDRNTDDPSTLDWDKRNLEALARSGYIRTLPSEDEEDPGFKRSIANLAKNGQLPAFQNNESKRGIESLARNGELRHRKDLQELLDELYNKRNIGNLARNYDLPSYGKRFIGSLAKSGNLPYAEKRNIAALARDGALGKRNVAALLRQDNYYKTQQTKNQQNNENSKRNIGSIKAQYPAIYKRSVNGRNKREADYFDSDEYPSPVYQNQDSYDYDELVRALGQLPETEKRFLGSIAKTGWFRPSSGGRMGRFQTLSAEKRHIGALARLGWLPSFRSVRRFNRSGRSACQDTCIRAASADGQAEDDPVAQDSLPLEDKRFLLQPAVDRILLPKLLLHPRTHSFINGQS